MRQEIIEEGFIIVENVFSEKEVEAIINVIDSGHQLNQNIRINNGLYAVRCLLQEFPKLKEHLFNDRFTSLISQFGEGYKLIKAIYFDKPPIANWVVNWHQDLTISVAEKVLASGFLNWLPKEEYFSVQPPKAFLEGILTIRVHLDDCTVNNGALNVLPKSHSEIVDVRNVPDHFFDEKVICEVRKGGVLIMKPLIWHSSRRTKNDTQRRIIHLEFSNMNLPDPLKWAELLEL